MAVIEGKIAFENMDKHELYKGQSTEKYSVVISLDDTAADTLAAKGIKLRDYEGVKQRKFTTKFEDTPVLNPDGSAFSGRMGKGSTVRLLWAEGPDHPVHGVATYLNKIKVLEVAEQEGGEDF
tara:strand:+ start:468 stop:836 length:369 start_codon:yes stop_codon:yes gene_type:complete